MKLRRQTKKFKATSFRKNRRAKESSSSIATNSYIPSPMMKASKISRGRDESMNSHHSSQFSIRKDNDEIKSRRRNQNDSISFKNTVNKEEKFHKILTAPNQVVPSIEVREPNISSEDKAKKEEISQKEVSGNFLFNISHSN